MEEPVEWQRMCLAGTVGTVALDNFEGPDFALSVPWRKSLGPLARASSAGFVISNLQVNLQLIQFNLLQVPSNLIHNLDSRLDYPFWISNLLCSTGNWISVFVSLGNLLLSWNLMLDLIVKFAPEW